MSASPEDIARVKWNRAADMYNQWETLDDEEKRELIARESPPSPAPVEGKCGTCGGILLGDTDKGIPGQCKCSITQPAARPTPITDAFINTVFNGLSEDDDYAAYVRTTAHARKLERQLAEANHLLAAVTRERDELAAVLKEIRAGYGGQVADPPAVAVLER